LAVLAGERFALIRSMSAGGMTFSVRLNRLVDPFAVMPFVAAQQFRHHEVDVTGTWLLRCLLVAY
jgi:hypothetical protein